MGYRSDGIAILRDMGPLQDPISDAAMLILPGMPAEPMVKLRLEWAEVLPCTLTVRLADATPRSKL